MTCRPACGEQDPKLSDSDPEKSAVVNNPVAAAPRSRPLSQSAVSNHSGHWRGGRSYVVIKLKPYSQPLELFTRRGIAIDVRQTKGRKHCFVELKPHVKW